MSNLTIGQTIWTNRSLSAKSFDDEATIVALHADAAKPYVTIEYTQAGRSDTDFQTVNRTIGDDPWHPGRPTFITEK